MSFAMAFGGIDETYRRIGWPSRPIRNLTKFQSSVPGRLPVRKSYTPLLAMQHRVEVGRQFSGFGSSQRGKPHELSAVYGMRQLLDMDREIVYPTPTTFDEELLARWKEERPLSFFDGLGDNDGLGRPGSQNPAAPGGKA